MGRIIAIAVLGIGMFALSYILFGHGLLLDFYTTLSSFTNLQTLESADETTIRTIIKFVINIFIYFAAAAVLIFIYDVLAGKKKQ